MSLCFPQNEDNIFLRGDITVSLMRNVANEDDCISGAFVALAHFHVEIDHDNAVSPSLDKKVCVDGDVKECKFDTLTFEELGGVIRLPLKRPAKQLHTPHHHYANCAKKILKIKQSDSSLEDDDPFYFPSDVFDHDVVFLDLPAKG